MSYKVEHARQIALDYVDFTPYNFKVIQVLTIIASFSTSLYFLQKV